MRLGIIGSLGYWGNKILNSANNIKDSWDIIEIDVSNNQDWRNDKMDAVIIATPAHLHKEMTEWYLTNNIHVLCEKPTSLSGQDQLLLNAIAEKNNLVYQPGHILLFQPTIVEMLNILQGKRIQHIESRRLNWGKLQTNINLAWNLAPHDISVIDKIIYALPKKDIKLITNNFNSSPFKDYAVFDLSYENFNSTIILGWHYPKKVRDFVVTCDDMQLFVDDTNIIITEGYYDPKTKNLKQTKTKNLTINHIYNPLEMQIKNFLSCVENKKVSYSVHNHMYRVAYTVELMSEKLSV